ncbi:MAG: VirK/YbjX family protein [Hafnia alvei]
MCNEYYSAQLLNPVTNTISHPFIKRPVNKYLNRKWSGKQKLRTAMKTLDVIEHAFSRKALEILYSADNDGIVLADIELKSGDIAQLKLMRSRFTREGDLGLYLFNENQEDVYGLTFSFGPKGELYLSGLQGPNTENGAEIVKSMTKLMHGMRPKNLLISALYALAQHFHISTIAGVANKAHIKSQHLKSSYDNFWLECGGELNRQGWYCLPKSEPERDIETVKSQHRSAFRKREALREGVTDAVSRNLQRYAAGAKAITANEDDAVLSQQTL